MAGILGSGRWPVPHRAKHLLWEKHRDVLEWLLAPSGPLHGHAHVHLTEKACFVVDRTADLLLGDGTEALALYRQGRRAFGEERWREFLDAANRLLRVRDNGKPGEPVEVFFRTVHDRQNMLTEQRIAWIEEQAVRAGVGVGFAGLEPVQARWDPRILLAHFLAGIARKPASDELNGRADPALIALLRPFVGRTSVWDDERSSTSLTKIASAPSTNINSAV